MQNRKMKCLLAIVVALLPLAVSASDSANFRVPLAATPLDS
jgi:hypothetical protein